MEAVPFEEDDDYPDYSKEEDREPPEDEDMHLWMQDWSDPQSFPADCTRHIREDHTSKE